MADSLSISPLTAQACPLPSSPSRAVSITAAAQTWDAVISLPSVVVMSSVIVCFALAALCLLLICGSAAAGCAVTGPPGVGSINSNVGYSGADVVISPDCSRAYVSLDYDSGSPAGVAAVDVSSGPSTLLVAGNAALGLTISRDGSTLYFTTSSSLYSLNLTAPNSTQTLLASMKKQKDFILTDLLADAAGSTLYTLDGSWLCVQAQPAPRKPRFPFINAVAGTYDAYGLALQQNSTAATLFCATDEEHQVIAVHPEC
jgi:hypothetical protein